MHVGRFYFHHFLYVGFYFLAKLSLKKKRFLSTNKLFQAQKWFGLSDVRANDMREEESAPSHAAFGEVARGVEAAAARTYGGS
ncbi:hypothetical protein GOBAR_DD22654 [Gossypium barbadense]|nr:hypothetical protein GOBAR_DD22654 [Gossypium barbadense]